MITNFYREIAHGRPPTVFGNGSQTRDFVHAMDIARANVLAMKNDKRAGIYNIGSGRSISILELARRMIAIAGRDLEPVFSDAREGDVMHSLADIRLARDELGWEPDIRLEDWLEKLFHAGSD